MLEKKVKNFLFTEGISKNIWKYLCTAMTEEER
jgi:hypothetical protein